VPSEKIKNSGTQKRLRYQIKRKNLHLFEKGMHVGGDTLSRRKKRKRISGNDGAREGHKTPLLFAKKT